MIPSRAKWASWALFLIVASCGGPQVPARRDLPPASFFSDAQPLVTLARGDVGVRIVGALLADEGLYLDVLFDGDTSDLAKLASHVGYDVSWTHSDTRDQRTGAVELMDSAERPVPVLRAKPVTGFFIAPPYIGPPPQRILATVQGRSRVVQQLVFRVEGPISPGAFRVRLTEECRADDARLTIDQGWYRFDHTRGADTPGALRQ